MSYNLVYVLKLQDDGYYVGVSSNLNARLGQHFGGTGSVWTRLHKPIRLLAVWIGGEDKENEIARIYIERYGFDKVRGGKYLRDKKIPINYLLKMIKI